MENPIFPDIGLDSYLYTQSVEVKRVSCIQWGVFVGLPSNFQAGAWGKTFYCLLQAFSCMQAASTKKYILLHFCFLSRTALIGSSLSPAVALGKALLALRFFFFLTDSIG